MKNKQSASWDGANEVLASWSTSCQFMFVIWNCCDVPDLGVQLGLQSNNKLSAVLVPWDGWIGHMRYMVGLYEDCPTFIICVNNGECTVSSDLRGLLPNALRSQGTTQPSLPIARLPIGRVALSPLLHRQTSRSRYCHDYTTCWRHRQPPLRQVIGEQNWKCHSRYQGGQGQGNISHQADPSGNS